MTRPLRRRHLQIWFLLAVAMIAIFAASLAVRRDTTPRNAGVRWEALR